MKAIRVREFGGPEVLRIEEVSDPQVGPGQVLVHVHAIGVNPVETYIRAGKYPVLPPLPYTPGSDAAGVIEAVGEGVEGLTVGARVYIYRSLTGAYAQKILCDAAQVYPLPDKVSFAQGAGIGVPVGAAWRALFYRGQAKSGETVLVHGATGGVGLSAVQLARAAGLTVIGTSSSEKGRQLALEQGAHYVADHNITDDPAQLKSLTSGRDVDLILEMLANRNLGKDLGVLPKKGRVVVIGSRGPVEIDPRLTMGSELDIRGMTVNLATPEELRSMHSSIGEALETGALNPIIQEEMPLADAPRAHQVVIEGESAGKILLIP